MDHDLIIIGGGAAGLGAARAAAWAGARVLMVSDGPPGGDCTFTGCVPSKTLLAAARAGAEFGEAMTRVADTVDRIAATETAERLSRQGVEVIEDRARLVTHDSIAIGETRLSAPRLLIATGARPSVPPIPGLDKVDYLTNETVFDLSAPPTSMAVIGGGAIGCELAQAFSQLGVEVHLLEVLDRLIAREEPEASEVIERKLVAQGVKVRTGARISSVGDGPDGSIRLSVGGRDTTEDSLDVGRLLVATGRTPNSSGVGLESMGVELDPDGHIEVDERLATSVRGVYAAGDVTGKMPFTHAADEMGRLAAGNALRKGQRGKFRTHWVPWAMFTDPEVARVGLTEAEAADLGGRVAYLPLAELDRAVTEDRTDGFVKLIAGPKRLTRHLFAGRVVGATVVAARAGEMIHGPALAMRNNMFTGRLAQAPHVYPSWSHGIQVAAAQFFGRVGDRTARSAEAD